MGRCFEGQDWEHKALSGESKAGAVLLSLLLEHPVGVAGEEPPVARQNRDRAELGYFFLSKKQLKIGSHSLRQKAGGWEALSKVTDAAPDPRIHLPAMGVWDVEEKLVIPYSNTERVISKNERKKENHHSPFARRETKLGVPMGYLPH